jgi:hypothetical protein
MLEICNLYNIETAILIRIKRCKVRLHDQYEMRFKTWTKFIPRFSAGITVLAGPSDRFIYKKTVCGLPIHSCTFWLHIFW